MTAILAAEGLGKRYRSRWALRDCTVEIPARRVVGLVGPNGAGKTTLLHMAVGLLEPTEGRISVLGARPGESAAQLGQVGFVAQQNPLYPHLTVADHVRLGAWLNPHWDGESAERRVAELGLDPQQRTGKLSGGQHAQLALTLALAKRPQLLVLDEPVASLDPLARHGFLQRLMEAVAADEMGVVLSSHLIADLEQVCDHLILVTNGRVQLAGDVDALLGCHFRLTGVRRDPATLPAGQHVVEASHTDRQSTYLVRTDGPIIDPTWVVEPVGLEDLVLAYMRQAEELERPRDTQLGVVR